METLMATELDSNDLLVVEVLDAHGHMTWRERLPVSVERNRFTLGRSPSADVMLDDEHVAALHALIEVEPGGDLFVTDLGSINGLWLDGKRHRNAERLPIPGRSLRLGQTSLRLRLGSDAIPAEKLDQSAPVVGSFFTARNSGRFALFSGLLCIFFTFYYAWITAPRDLAMPLTISMLTSLVIVCAWSSIWSLLTRVMRGEWRWLSHAAVLLTVAAAMYALDLMLEIVWFSFDLPGGYWREMSILVLAGIAAMHGHLRLAAPMHRRTAWRAAIGATLLIAVPSLWMVGRSHNKDVNYIGENAPLYPARLHLRAPESLDDFAGAGVTLKLKADRLVSEMQDKDDEEGGDED